jgi:hypothetical protein
MRSTYRGHKIFHKGEDWGMIGETPWYYVDTRQLVSENPNRECGHCGKANTPEGHDGCLGTLKGVKNACCGHGHDSEAYIQFDDDTIVRGREAILKQESLK